MRRPEKKEAELFRSAFVDWIPIETAQSLSDEFRLAHGNFARGLRTGKFWRECFHALMFAPHLDVSHIKAGGDPPDFLFRTPAKDLHVELVVARDRDDATSRQFLDQIEFVGPTGIESIGQEALDESWKSLPERVMEHVRKKSAKNYSNQTNLAVAASSWWWDEEGNLMEQKIRSECSDYLSCFAGVWVLAGSHFIDLTISSPRT